jgi:hypothetical protein
MASQFASVLGVNRLLTYLETKGEGAIIKPWVWILWIGLGPLYVHRPLQVHLFGSL